MTLFKEIEEVIREIDKEHAKRQYWLEQLNKLAKK